MKTSRALSLAVLVFAFSLPLAAQDSRSPATGHADDPHLYHLGMGLAAAHIFSEKGLAPGFHVHVIRRLDRRARWGIGLGYEAIVDREWHNGLTLMASYSPLSFLSLQGGPGLVISRHDGKTEALPAFHVEAVFEVEWRGVHLGPMIGYGFDKEDSHVSAGIHAGVGF